MESGTNRAILAAQSGGEPPVKQKKHKMLATTKKAHIFCICVLAFMLVQWLLIFVYGNLNSVLLAFQHYDAASDTQIFYAGKDIFKNFGDFLGDLFSSENDLGGYFLTGVVYHLTGLVSLPISLVFAFVIYKKMPASGFMKIVLFVPSVISSMVIALLFKTMMLQGMRGLWTNVLGRPYNEFVSPLADNSKAFGTLLLYQFFFALPGSLLINIGTMSRTPEELVEYGRLEGFSYLQEFIHLTLPLMFPVLQIYCLGMFTGFFTAQGPLYAIYGDGKGTSIPESAISFGYYMMISVISDRGSGVSPEFMYGYTAAANLLIGLVSIPIVYGTKRLFDHFDPEANF